MNKKKRDRWILLLIVIAILAYIASTYGGVFGGFSPQPGEPNAGGCCCSDPFAYIVKAPGGQCQCITCSDAQPNLLVQNGTMCCTSNECDKWAVL
jgi:hypothetical protein